MRKDLVRRQGHQGCGLDTILLIQESARAAHGERSDLMSSQKMQVLSRSPDPRGSGSGKTNTRGTQLQDHGEHRGGHGRLSSSAFWDHSFALSLGRILWLPKELCSCKLCFVIRNEGTEAGVRLLVFKSCIHHLPVV